MDLRWIMWFCNGKMDAFAGGTRYIELSGPDFGVNHGIALLDAEWNLREL